MEFLPGPISVEVQQADPRYGLKHYAGPAIWIGAMGNGTALVVTDEGRLKKIPIDNLVVDWRYDWREQSWVEVNGVTDGTEEAGDDGGTDIPGQLLDVEGAGNGDSIDQEGGPAAGDPGNVDAGAER